MQKLFLSFTRILSELRNDRINSDDLATGLFYFGCSRSHALDPWKDQPNEVLWFFKDEERGRVMHAMFSTAILKAEAEGRVAWQKKGDHNYFKALSDLLRANGFDNVISEDCDEIYAPSQVARLVEESGIPLDVVCP